MDYCNMTLAGAPKSVTDRLQRALNAAVRLVSGTRKYDRDCRRFCMLTCTGSMWQIGFGTS